ncbi:MAG: hypothetical protein K9M98_00885 [Cephaloticoccus sp.]|nr:hypothetical protein [Cephaloticoccus sp.]MCF7759033.1 hypothetical protein [Cephaloticoccus sp.]
MSFHPPIAEDSAGRLLIQLKPAHQPARVPNHATLVLQNIKGFEWWSGAAEPVGSSGDGTQWAANLSPRAAESILLCDRGEIRFKSENEGVPPLVVAIPQSRLQKALGQVVPRMRGKPMFFNPPSVAPAPTPPAISADRKTVEDYAIAMETWDQEAQKGLFDFENTLVSARSLWRDMRTARHLPWANPDLDQFESLYDTVMVRHDNMVQQRKVARQLATNYIARWNAQFAPTREDRPITLNF